MAKQKAMNDMGEAEGNAESALGPDEAPALAYAELDAFRAERDAPAA